MAQQSAVSSSQSEEGGLLVPRPIPLLTSSLLVLLQLVGEFNTTADIQPAGTSAAGG